MKPFQLVLRYTRHYTWQLAITVISMLLLVGVQLTLPWIIKTLIDVVTPRENQYTDLGNAFSNGVSQTNGPSLVYECRLLSRCLSWLTAALEVLNTSPFNNSSMARRRTSYA